MCGGVELMAHPGKILEMKLKETGMSRKELSQRTGVTEKHISTVITGEKSISTAFARKLGYVFETTSYWLDLQAKYDDEQLSILEENSISTEEISVLKPLHEIMDYFLEQKYIHNDCGDASKVMQMRELLNVSDLTLIPRITYYAAYRAQLTSNVRVDPYVLFAWQRLCEKKTEGIQIVNELNISKLRSSLEKIKALMFENINDVVQKMQLLLADCGIAFQVVKNFRGAPVQGFIKDTGNRKVILCLTIRKQRADIFWFTLFHEIAHILHGDYSARFVDFDSVQSEQEAKADAFARDILIAPDIYRKYLSPARNITWNDVETMANEAHVQPYVALGRLQNDGILDWSEYSGKVVRYSWA